jgi:hypothetical protein
VSAAAARALAPLTREEAIEILNRMPYLVATSSYKLLNSMILSSKATERPDVFWSEYEVWNGKRRYVFEKQPFRVLREITREEFKAAAPEAQVPSSTVRCYFYEIHSD